jgi:hypothetical protein
VVSLSGRGVLERVCAGRAGMMNELTRMEERVGRPAWGSAPALDVPVTVQREGFPSLWCGVKTRSGVLPGDALRVTFCAMTRLL